MQWLTVVPVLHNLGLSMVHYRASGTGIPGFFWCGYNPIHLPELIVESLTVFFCFAVLVILMTLDWALPHLSILADRKGTLRSGLPWFSLSVGLNIIVTLMICFRLIRMRALLKQALAPEMSSMYTNIAAMVVESSAPFSIVGIGLLITTIRNGPLSPAFAYVWNMFYVCSVPSPPAYSPL